MSNRETVPLTDESAPAGPIQLVGRVSGREVGKVTLGRAPVVIGSAPECDLVLDDSTVSRRHLEVEVRGSGLFIKDLGSTNGTKLYGSRVKEAFVPVGAALLLGKAELRVEAATPTPRAALGPLQSVAPSMMQAIEQLAKVAPSEATVLLEAETGCGKEVAARAVHDHSARSAAPFETVDCGALPRELASSELFGHVKGAFTGADRTKPGAFERANGGTVFLDEIGELPLELQPLLLRALESRKVRRVGDDAYRPIDVRVIAATNRDLEKEVEAGRFRRDLLHRLAVVRVRLPPLRERTADIPLLARAILEKLGPRAVGFSLSPDTLRALAAHPWSGNVRELRNLIERAVALSDDRHVSPEALGFSAAKSEAPPLDYKAAREKALDSFERDFVVHVLRTFDRNVTRASREAGIDRVYLHKLIKKHGIVVGEL